MADINAIIKQISGNKDLLKQISKADLSQAKELLKKANIKIDDADIKKVQAALADGKLDLKDVTSIAGELFKK
ncbi:MAG: hypothetical protein K6G04_05130 [Lachnospiraceae bacterium]|nr:hypothetical protein [Lachnospiraceae bacterium]